MCFEGKAQAGRVRWREEKHETHGNCWRLLQGLGLGESGNGPICPSRHWWAEIQACLLADGSPLTTGRDNGRK
jgi:hypothetical protein